VPPLDHLNQLHDDLSGTPSPTDGWQPPAGFEAGARALAAWLDVTKDPATPADPAIVSALEDASTQLTAERKTGRERTLENVALQRAPVAAARAELETLAWADGALYHAWRLAESLRISSGDQSTGAAGDTKLVTKKDR
jgi:phosphate:Na+ symporter